MGTKPKRFSIRVYAALCVGASVLCGMPVAMGSVTPGATNINYYVSPIDGSSQPYSVYVCNPYNAAVKHPVVIDLHGFGGRFKATRDAGEAARNVPNVLFVVEDLGIAHVEGAVDIGLDAKHQQRITHVLPHGRGHLVLAGKQRREERAVSPHDRVLFVEYVERRLAVVGVDGRFDRIANVVNNPAS